MVQSEHQILWRSYEDSVVVSTSVLVMIQSDTVLQIRKIDHIIAMNHVIYLFLIK